MYESIEILKKAIEKIELSPMDQWILLLEDNFTKEELVKIIKLYNDHMLFYGFGRPDGTRCEGLEKYIEESKTAKKINLAGEKKDE